MIVTRNISLEEVVCGTCGITHAVPQEWIDNRRATAGDIVCPNGCRRTWAKSDAQRFREQLEIKERELRESKCETLRKQQLLEAEQQARARVERKLNRVHKGVCPCCKRSFPNLQRHIKTKHPNEALKV